MRVPQPISHYIALGILVVIALHMIIRFHDHPDILGIIGVALLGLALLWPVEREEGGVE